MMRVTDTFSCKMAANQANTAACRALVMEIAAAEADFPGLEKVSCNWTGGWLRSTVTWELVGDAAMVLKAKQLIMAAFQ